MKSWNPFKIKACKFFPLGSSQWRETVWVQEGSSGPRKGDNFDTKSIEIIALFVAFRGIFTLFSAFDGSFDR